MDEPLFAVTRTSQSPSGNVSLELGSQPLPDRPSDPLGGGGSEIPSSAFANVGGGAVVVSGTASVVVVAIVIYVITLQFFAVDYRIATGLFVLLTGGYLTRNSQRLWPVVVVLGFLLSLGLHFLFSRVLVVDLP